MLLRTQRRLWSSSWTPRYGLDHNVKASKTNQQRNKSSFTLSSCGVLLDIDGVLLRGRKPIPQAGEALRKLHRNGIPFVFLTNGGGVTEQQKVEQLMEKLAVDFLHEDQMILAHTPLKHLYLDRYRNDRVLIVGTEQCESIAHGYGFVEAISVDRYVSMHPEIYPFSKHYRLQVGTSDINHFDATDRPFRAIFAMHDSVDMAQDLQVIIDVLRSDGRPGEALSKSHQDVQIILCNPDLLFASEYPWPRFGQGLLKTALVSAFRETKSELEGKEQEVQYTQMGKPTKITYDFAKEHLQTVAQKRFGRSDAERVTSVFGVGDNVRADIRGANWNGVHSVLVRTGVFTDERQDPETTDPDLMAKTLVHDVNEFVDRLLSGDIVFEAESQKGE